MLPLTTSLAYGDLGSVRLTLADPWLTPGPGSHRLTFPMTSYASWLEHVETTARTPLLLAGTAWVELGGLRWLGSVVPQTLGLCGFHAGGDDLVVSLSDQQLVAIEAARGPHDDLRLHLKLQGTLLGVEPETYPIRNVDVAVSVRATRWLELLDQLGHGIALTLHIPSPPTDDGAPVAAVSDEDRASHAQVTFRLRQARDHLRDGAYEEAVASCRRALEVLGRLITLPSVKEVSAVSPQRRTQEQRWAAMYHDTKSLTSAAHHEDETTAAFVWTRADAEGVWTATAGLVRRLLS